MATMKAIVKANPEKGMVIMDVEIPEIQEATDVKLKVLKSSVCGTDKHIYDWDEWSQKTIKTPQINGHEVLAEIVEVGSAVKNFKVGEVVACETHIYCGNCYLCRTGSAHVCECMEILGVNRDGIWCEYQVVPQNILWKVDGIDPIAAGVLEPLGNAIHTSQYSDLRGKHVMVMGAGPIGVMACLVSKVSGAATVTCVELNEYRQNMAMKMGINGIINPVTDDMHAKVAEITGGHGIDVVLEMTGAPAALKSACDIIIQDGEINVLSVYPTDMVEVPMNDLVFKNVKLQMLTGRKLFSTWNIASEWLKFNVLDPEKIEAVVTHNFKMEDFDKAFEVMASGECGKCILDFTYLHEEK